MLQPLKSIYSAKDYPNLLAGFDPPDDGAVWKLDDHRSLVLTTDFFTPVVDDPYDYGAIAAANALSDIYAMGGTPFLALNIAAFPPQLPKEISREIIRGGAEKAKEAGVIIAGGHTIQDQEPKYGLIVVGTVETSQLMQKSNVRSGDILILTKPLGTGVTTTALKREQADAIHVKEAVDWMKKLNKKAATLALACEINAATDITGFSILGHAHEMADSSQVKLVFHQDRIPFLSGALDYGRRGFFAGGAADNRMYYSPFISFPESMDEFMQMLLFDPQTSGGLLLACRPEMIEHFRRMALQENLSYWEIGFATLGRGIVVR